MKTNNHDLAAVPSTALLGDFSESDYNALMYFCTESSPERWCEWEAKLNAIRYLYPEFIAALELKRKATSHFYAVVDAMKYPPNPSHQGTTHLVRRTLDGVVRLGNQKEE